MHQIFEGYIQCKVKRRFFVILRDASTIEKQDEREPPPDHAATPCMV